MSQDVFLFDFNLVYVGNYLDAHGTLTFLELQLLIFLVGFNDLRNLSDTVCQDFSVLLKTLVIYLAVFSFNKFERANT